MTRAGWPLLLAALVSLASAQGPAPDPNAAAVMQALQAVHSAPDSEAERIALASLYLKLGQNRGASATLLEYVNQHPKAPKATRLLALSYLREENYPAAKDYAQRALRLEPGDAATTEVLGMAQLGLQDAKAAEQSFREAVRLDPNLIDANFQLGLLYVNKHENLSDALHLLQRARALNPNLPGVYTALGAALLESGKAADAAMMLERATKLDPESAESWYQLASAYKQLDRADDAEHALARFSELSKKRADERARDMRSRSLYEQGVNLLTNTDQVDKAYDLFEKASHEALIPDAPYYRMAQILYLKGNDAAALKLIREALRLNPYEPEYYFVLARCLEATDKPAALAAVRQAITLKPGVADFEELEAQLRK